MSSHISALSTQYDLPMSDAMEDMIVKVMAIDVQLGVPRDPHCCAFSRACRRDNGREIVGAHFYRTTVWIESINGLVKYDLPQKVRRAICQFDQTHTMPPGTYTLRAPRGSSTRAAIAARSAKRTGRHQPGNGKIRRNPTNVVTNLRKFEFGFASASVIAKTKPVMTSTVSPPKPKWVVRVVPRQESKKSR
jgi:hypothetical protein